MEKLIKKLGSPPQSAIRDWLELNRNELTRIALLAGVALFICALDNPADIKPRCHTYTDTKLPWLHISDGLPAFTEPEMPPVVERWKAELS